MRGVVFTELIEFVENALGFEVADEMIAKAKLENGGAFSQGGNYPFEDLQKLVVSLSEITQKKPEELLFLFGENLFATLVTLYGQDIQETGGSLEFIDSVENFVHVEVKKLYPDADLPTFTTVEKGDNSLVFHYKSNKKLEAFAHGLMVACGKYFNENIEIEYKVISEEPHTVEFSIQRS